MVTTIPIKLPRVNILKDNSLMTNFVVKSYKIYFAIEPNKTQHWCKCIACDDFFTFYVQLFFWMHTHKTCFNNNNAKNHMRPHHNLAHKLSCCNVNIVACIFSLYRMTRWVHEQANKGWWVLMLTKILEIQKLSLLVHQFFALISSLKCFNLFFQMKNYLDELLLHCCTKLHDILTL